MTTEPDFSGWATKAEIKCSDGRTIAPDAFKHQDKVKVPLVYQHDHKDVENILGHTYLYNRPEGVWCESFFNDTPKAKLAKAQVQHGDITMLSIWANDLKEVGSSTAKRVIHGIIREVSLVLAGANPGARIDNVRVMVHSDEFGEDVEVVLEEEAIIHTAIEFDTPKLEPRDATDTPSDDDIQHAAGEFGPDTEDFPAIYKSMDEKQKELMHYTVALAIETAEAPDATAAHDGLGDEPAAEVTPEDGTPAEVTPATPTQEDNADTGKEGTETMAHSNVFEQGSSTGGEIKHGLLSKDEFKKMVTKAKRNSANSLKHVFEDYAEEHLEHGINDIDQLFPDPKNTDQTPQLLKRETEWVAVLMDGIKKLPYAKIRTIWADLTFDEARAKGYVKGNMKKEEFFGVVRRVTEPTTIYKKQKLDRDDMIDITDFDVVVWLKGEMRILLEEEVARGVLLGDGREADHPDKINEEKLRPIMTDSEVFTTTVRVNLLGEDATFQQVIDQLVRHRSKLKGSGSPVMFTTETQISEALLLKDTLNRDLYTDLAQLETKLRVKKIVPVEAMEEYEDVICILVNPIDYSMGTDVGGQVTWFDDFDIDFNQYKYLGETRCSGALTKLQSALVVLKTTADVVLIDAVKPAFNKTTGVVTIPDEDGIIYTNHAGTPIAAGPMAAIEEGATVEINAEADTGFAFNVSSVHSDQWLFTRDDS